MPKPAPSSVFFQCQRCANCCRWPGDVNIEEDEIEPIARFLKLDANSFIRDFTRLRKQRNGLSLIERTDDSCIFLHGNSCRIQAVKPRQCKGFPNEWNFPGWRKVCEAVPIPVPTSPQAPRNRK